VLEGGIRVITNRGLQKALGMAESGGAQRLADLMNRFASKGIDNKDLTARMKQPIEFRPLRGGRSAFGYEALVLADICDVTLAARTGKALSTKFETRNLSIGNARRFSIPRLSQFLSFSLGVLGVVPIVVHDLDDKGIEDLLRSPIRQPSCRDDDIQQSRASFAMSA